MTADSPDVTMATTDLREHDGRREPDAAAGCASMSGSPGSSRRDAGTPLEGLRGSIAPPAISPLYRLGLAAVFLLLVLLPLIAAAVPINPC